MQIHFCLISILRSMHFKITIFCKKRIQQIKQLFQALLTTPLQKMPIKATMRLLVNRRNDNTEKQK